MEIFGMSIGEIITMIASAIAVIITVMRAGRKDVTTESVEHLLEPLNTRNEKLRSDLEAQKKLFEEYKKRNAAWKMKFTKKLVAVTAELDQITKEAESDDS